MRASWPERQEDGLASESSPLLSGDSDSRDPPQDVPSAAHSSHHHPKFLRVATIIIVAIFIVEIGDYMIKAPLMRLIEDAICRSYYESAQPSLIDLTIPIPEEDCKGPLVQSDLAMLKGWDTMLSCIPGLLLSVPYGVLADMHGRKLVLLLALGGLILSFLWGMAVLWFSNVFDIHWYLAGNMFLIIGGGPPVIRAMLYAMISDVAPEEQRTRVFSQISAAAVIATLAAIPLSWYLMKIDVWIPMFFIFGFFTLGFVLCLFLPETLEHSKVPNPDMEIVIDEDSREGNGFISGQNHSLPNKIPRIFRNTLDNLSIFKSYLLFSLSFTFILNLLHGYSLEILFQLASERFHWPLRDASFLFPISSVTTFLALIVALPAVYHLLTTRYQMSTMAKDLLVARGSLIIFILGSLAVALGSTPSLFVIGTMIYACGSGFSPAQRSLVTSLVHPDEVSRLYAVLGVIETLGLISYGFLLPKSFGWGSHLGGLWNGMAFLVCAALFLVIGLPIWLVKEPEPEMDVHG